MERRRRLLTTRFFESAYGYALKVSRPLVNLSKVLHLIYPHLAFGTVPVRHVYQRTKARAVELARQPKLNLALKVFRDTLA